MSRLLVALLTVVVALGLSLPDTADAKRFGGGRSLGKQYSTPHKSQQTSRQSDTRNSQTPAGTTPPRQSGISRWLGPLAGLAAGGLLASMFFGDGFQGFQILDFLIIAALVIGGIMLFKTLRKRGAAGGLGNPLERAATAGTPGYARPTSSPPPIGIEPIGGGSLSTNGPDAADAPPWFDASGFAEGAKTHFIRLQAAWDQADFRDIRDYTTPQLFAEVKREREQLGDAPNYTEVVTLDAELLGIQRDRDLAVASVRFTGLVREEDNGTANRIDEIWHVQHAWNTPDGDWMISGIQQQS